MENRENKHWKISCGGGKKHGSEFKFWLGDLSPKDIQVIVNYIIQEKNPGVEYSYFDCNIADNIAKLVIEYDTDKHHTIKRSFNEYGVIDKNGDVVESYNKANKSIRKICSQKFGKLYDYAVEDKFGVEVAQD